MAMNRFNLTHASLFSGIGGFDLAAEWAGITNIFQVEKDEFCQKVLNKNFPNTEKYRDIYEFNGTKYNGEIDIISGGFPCQPFSVAGKRKGTKDDRYLWDEMFRVITEVKPSWIIAENVGGLLTIEDGLVFEKCLSDLESENYSTQAFIIPAISKNAPHRRDRVWIVANNNGNGNKGFGVQFGNISKTGQRRKSDEENCNNSWEQNWYEVATEFCRVDDGIPNRVDRLKSLGNAIVPQVAYEIFQGIKKV
jgi:DNA (cytosine-5)-methyltransferase 1